MIENTIPEGSNANTTEDDIHIQYFSTTNPSKFAEEKKDIIKFVKEKIPFETDEKYQAKLDKKCDDDSSDFVKQLNKKTDL